MEIMPFQSIKMCFIKTLFIIFSILQAFTGFSQVSSIKGVVYDSQSKEPLAFVILAIQNTKTSCVTDVNGRFELPVSTDNVTIISSYLGYEPKQLMLSTLDKEIKIYLTQKQNILQEVVIRPGENPANRIVRRVVDNKDKNNPEKNRSFTYTSYNKMKVTNSDKEEPDTTTKQLSGMDSLMNKQHLLVSESISQRQFLYPDNNKETVIASRFSGFKKSPFSVLATQLQSFSFYSESISVLGKQYLNPINDGTLSRYYFQLEDTLYDKGDTVFIMSFRPLKNKNFNGLKGSLYIHTNGYAVQHVIAEPFLQDGALTIKIQQEYKIVDNKQWFPYQLNTDWIYNNVNLSGNQMAVGNNTDSTNMPSNKLKVICKTYLQDIVLNPTIPKKTFSEYEVEHTDNASEAPDALWAKYRTDSLSLKDKQTYKVVDSIGRKNKLDEKLFLIEAFTKSQLPYKCINIDLKQLLRYNEYEGLRVGLGLHTNQRLVKWASIGGYVGYGFRDKTLKYGGDIDFTLWKKQNMHTKLVFENDVVESAGRTFYSNDTRLIVEDNIRNLYISKMDRYTKYEANISFRTLKYINATVFANHQTRWGNIPFATVENSVASPRDTFQLNEVGTRFRFAPKEKLIDMVFMDVVANPLSTYPVFYVNIIKGFSQSLGSWKGEFDYWLLDAKIEKRVNFTHIGKQHWQLQLGKVIGNVPYTLLYNNKGSFLSQYTVAGNNTFETMGLNEFTSSTYASLFFSHNFGRFLPYNKHINPELELAHNMGWGTLEHTTSNFNIGIRTLEKGYYESGIRINNVYVSNFLGLGLGAYYRYGPYTNKTTKENIAVKITFSYVL